MPVKLPVANWLFEIWVNEMQSIISIKLFSMIFSSEILNFKSWSVDPIKAIEFSLAFKEEKVNNLFVLLLFQIKMLS